METLNSVSLYNPLYQDIKLLGQILEDIIKSQENPKVFQAVEKVRKISETLNLNEMKKFIQHLPDDIILPFTRALTQFLHLNNIAEQYNRIRRSKWHLKQSKNPQPGSLQDVIPQLQEKNINTDLIFSTICNLNIELVLTAHPTEVKRRTIMHKYAKIEQALSILDQDNLTELELQEQYANIASELTAVWQTPEIRKERPTAISEARWGFAVIESSLWQAIPKFLRDLDAIVFKTTKQKLPINITPIKFGSWIGGDRDGNPFVTAAVTKNVCLTARWIAANLYLQEINILYDDISINTCSAQLKNRYPNSDEPYRQLLQDISARLHSTKEWAGALLHEDIFNQENKPPIYKDSEELLDDLYLCYNSLVSCNASLIANGHLLDVIRQVHCFGLSLCKLDLRQESSKHSILMDKITKSLHLDSYTTWSEKQKQQFLIEAINNTTPIIKKDIIFDDEELETLNTFKLIAELPTNSFNSYIISMSKQPSDILLVALLQQEAQQGLKTAKFLPIVPLFETLDDLHHAAACMDNLFNIPWYRDKIQGTQEVMIGYSDSTKDAGFIAASWAQYKAQEELIAVANKHNIDLIFFHGRGGSIGRGGWPTHIAINSQPPGSIKNKLRVTQQGEVINNRFGNINLAKRTFSVYTTSILEATLLPKNEPTESWRAMMEEMSSTSAKYYKEIVAQDTNFFDYFQAITPTRELGKLAIGSRPQKRSPATNITSLRAIPWVFAWTQNRMLLPTWLGIRHGLEAVINKYSLSTLQDMAKNWNFFSSILNMTDMVLAKVDLEIAYEYSNKLVAPDLQYFTKQFSSEFENTKKLVLNILSQDELLQHNRLLREAIKFRKLYLLPLHLLQIELLHKTRATPTDSTDDIMQALLVSITGIAAGMKNTG